MNDHNVNFNQSKKLNNFIDDQNKKLRYSARISTNIIESFKYAFRGFKYSFKTQRNFRIHLIFGLLALFLSIWLEVSSNHLAILVLTITSVLVLELVNTAIEAVVDLSVGRDFHPLAAIAKDCSAAAVLIASISSLLIAVLLILKPLLLRIGVNA